MKLTKLWASALALLTLASCSQDVDVVQPQEAPRTRQVHIDLTAGQDANALRVTYGLDSDGKTTGLLMSDKNVILRVAVRRGTGAPVVQDLEFTKTPNRNHATYSGQISIPNDGSGDYTIAAILMREAGADGKVYSIGTTDDSYNKYESHKQRNAIASFNPTNIIADASSTVEANIPYVTKWQPFTVNTSGVAEPVTLSLRPFGTLLRIRIKNESASPLTFNRIGFSSNAFTPSVGFYLAAQRGDYPEWGGGSALVFSMRLASPITVPGKTGTTDSYSKWLYTVVYPRADMNEAPVTIARLMTPSGDIHPVFRTTQGLPHGSVPMTLVYRDGHQAEFEGLIEHDEFGSSSSRPKLAIEYVSDYALAQGGTSFVSDHTTTNSQLGTFTQEEARALPQTITIDGANYSLPTRDEAMSIFPPTYDVLTGAAITSVAGTWLNYFEPNVKIGNTTRNYVSDYVMTSGITGPMYGLRFKYSNNCTAYRYIVTGDVASNTRALRVDCIYVGGETIDVTQVATESFWTNRVSEIVSRTFPLYGERYHPTVATFVNRNDIAYYWTSTPIDGVSGYTLQVGNTAFAATPPKTYRSYGPIRLWKRD